MKPKKPRAEKKKKSRPTQRGAAQPGIFTPPYSKAVALHSLFLPVVFFASFLFFYCFGVPLFSDPDTPWHIATGDLIRTTHHLPATDQWSFTAPGHSVSLQAWLWDLLISEVTNSFGLHGLFVFCAAWFAGIITLLGYILMRRGGITQDALMISLTLVAFALFSNQGGRPQLFTYAGILLFQLLLHKSRTKFTHTLYVEFGLLMLLWANMHGGFTFAFILLGAYGLEAFMRKDYVWLKRLIMVGVLCVAAACFTPAGPGLWLGVLQQFTSLDNGVNAYIQEWQPYRFQAYAGFDALLLVLFLATDFRDKTVPIAEKTLTAGALLAALFSLRNFPVLALVCAPMLARCIEQCLLHKSEEENLLKPHHALLGWSGALVLCVALVATPARKLMSGEDPVIEKKNTPVKALAFLREHYPYAHFFNSYGFGGFMIYYNRDTHKVFIDGRAVTAYPPEVMQRYIDFVEGKLTPDVVGKYDIQGWFLKTNEASSFQSLILQGPKWTLVYRDKVASIYMQSDLAKFRDPSATQDPSAAEAAHDDGAPRE